MATVKIVLRAKKLADDTFPVAIRITKDRKSSFITLGMSIPNRDWDGKSQRVKKSHPNAARLNLMFAKRLAEVTDKGLELEGQNKAASSRAIRSAFKGAKEGTYAKQAAIYVKRLNDAKKFNQLWPEEPRIRRFTEFLGHSDIGFTEIDVPLLKRYMAWLKGTREVSDRTIANHLVVLRTIFNQAIAAKLVDPKYYPFGRGGITIKFPETTKIGLNIADVQAIEQAQVEGEADHARNIWLFSFYFAGMRISDVLRLKWSAIQDGRLYYSMGKNSKPYSLKIPDKAAAILEKYRRVDPVHDLVFPDLERLPVVSDDRQSKMYIKTRTKANNYHLQKVLAEVGIQKTVTMHISRHSWASIAGNTVPLPIVQKALGHKILATTANYMSHFNHDLMDSALDKVVGF